MPTYSRAEIIERICSERVSAIIRSADQHIAQQAMQAAVDGGFKLVEFTLTTPGAFELIEQFAKQPQLMVGAGTVLTIEQARMAVEAGASFLVSPVCDPEVLAVAASLNVACIPGTYTPTEMQAAHRVGADFVKLFPAPAGGVEYVRSVLGPLPHLKIFPTAGVTPENFTTFLDVGCAGVGFVRTLFVPTDIAEKNFVAIESRARLIVDQLEKWQSSKVST